MTSTATRYTPGQLVRFVGNAVDIAHGSVGSVQHMHHGLTNCPVVWFPRGTHGPYGTFVITRPAADLEPMPSCECKSTTTGTWYGQGHDATCPHARPSDRKVAPPRQVRNTESGHRFDPCPVSGRCGVCGVRGDIHPIGPIRRRQSN